MRKFLGFALLVGLAYAGYFVVKDNRQDYTKPTSGENILIFGDSLAYGQGSTNENDIASILNRSTPYRVINAGVSGDTTLNAVERLEMDVFEKHPRAVVIIIGGNDFFQQIPLDQTMQALTRMVDEILSSGAGVILVNERKIFASSSEFKKLAESRQIPYIENILDGIIGNESLMSDTFHPNNAGYALMAEKIKPVLLDYLK